MKFGGKVDTLNTILWKLESSIFKTWLSNWIAKFNYLFAKAEDGAFNIWNIINLRWYTFMPKCL